MTLEWGEVLASMLLLTMVRQWLYASRVRSLGSKPIERPIYYRIDLSVSTTRVYGGRLS